MKHILVIDDERALLRSFKRLLEGPNLKVDTCESLSDAERLISQVRYDAVVTDLRLNETDREEGLGIAKIVKAKDAAITVILITAYGSEELREESNLAGVDFYFEKPISPKTIQDILDIL